MLHTPQIPRHCADNGARRIVQGGAELAGNGAGVAINVAITPEFDCLDDDVTIARAEFLAATDRLLALLDRYGAGLLSADDLGRGRG